MVFAGRADAGSAGAGGGAGKSLGHETERLAAAKSRHEDANQADDAAAVTALRAFIQTLDAQRGRTIALAEADARARQIGELIEPSGGR